MINLIFFIFLLACAPKIVPLTTLEQHQAFELFDKHIMAIGGTQQLQQRTSFSIKGHIKEISTDKTHEYHLQKRAPNLYYIRINMIGTGIFERGSDGSIFWERTPRGASILEDSVQSKMLPNVDFYHDLNYRKWYSEITARQVVEFGGQACDMLETVTFNGQTEQVFFSQDTGLKAGVVRMVGTEQETIIRYGHYIDKGGLKIPLSTEEKMAEIHRVWVIDQFVWDKADADFSPPPSLQGKR
jgi:hypothetical protein